MEAMEPRDSRRPFPLYRRIAYGTANFTTLLAVSMWFTYSVAFYQKVLQLPPQSAGTIILVAQIGGAISTPFVGIWSDDCRCRIPGRRKVFQLMGVVCVAGSFIFMWHDCLGCSTAPVEYRVLYYSCFAIVFHFGWASAQIGQLALIPELTSNKSVQVELNSIRYGYSIAANLIMFSCFWILLEKVDKKDLDTSNLTPDDKMIFWIMAVVVVCVGVPVSMIFQCCIHENSHLRRPPALKWHQWLRNPKFYLGACGYTAARIMIMVPQSYLPLYFIETLHMDRTSIAKGPLILYITGFIFTFFVKQISKRLGAKMSFFLGMAIVWGAAMWFWLADASTATPTSTGFKWPRDSIYGAVILLGAGGAFVNVISMTLVAYMVGPYVGSSAFVYGWVVFADKFAIGAVVKIIQQMHPSEEMLLPDFYRHVLVFLPLAGSALGLFMVSSLVMLEWIQNRRENLKGRSIGLNVQEESLKPDTFYGSTSAPS